MKAISSSIVIAAGLYGVIRTVPTLNQMVFSPISFGASAITLALGLVGWWATLKYDR
jgi:hypothetical protein